MQPQQQFTGSEQGPAPTSSPLKPRRRLSGITWMLIVIAIFFVLGWAITALKKQSAPGVSRRAATVERTTFGVNDFENVEDGVSFGAVDPPDGPADKAGLVGGDIITSFDGRAVRDRDGLIDLLRQTPAGKTVEVIYLRDGEVRKTKLITISSQQLDELADAFADRPSGQAQLGFDDNDAERVSIPGTKMHGVQLHSVRPNGPAFLAGIQEGDIVVEFDGAPIRTVLELFLRVRRSVPYSTVKVIVMRGAEQVEIQVKMGRRRR
jgi:S1-C subfamily serine protease